MFNDPMLRLISSFSKGNFDVKAEEIFAPVMSESQIEFEKWCVKQGRMCYDIAKDPDVDPEFRAPYKDHQTCVAYDVWIAAFEAGKRAL